jgi:hypothetical protein
MPIYSCTILAKAYVKDDSYLFNNFIVVSGKLAARLRDGRAGNRDLISGRVQRLFSIPHSNLIFSGYHELFLGS